MMDEQLEAAMLQTMNTSRYDMTVPEEQERFIYNTRTRVPSMRIETIRAAVRRKFGRNAGASQDVESAADAAAYYTEPLVANATDDAIDGEVDRVLDEVTRKLKESLQSEAFLEESSPLTNEWYVTVRTRYSVVAAQAIEEEIREAFHRSHCNTHRRRPFFRGMFRYNINERQPKKPADVFLVAFFFQFIQDPRVGPATPK